MLPERSPKRAAVSDSDLISLREKYEKKLAELRGNRPAKAPEKPTSKEAPIPKKPAANRTEPKKPAADRTAPKKEPVVIVPETVKVSYSQVRLEPNKDSSKKKSLSAHNLLGKLASKKEKLDSMDAGAREAKEEQDSWAKAELLSQGKKVYDSVRRLKETIKDKARKKQRSSQKW